MESEEDLGLHRCPRRLSRGSGVGFADDFEMEMMDFSEEGSKKSPVESLDERLGEESAEGLKVQDNQDVVTEVLHAEDDPSLNALTFRVWFIGIGLGIFGAIVDTMYFFRPLSLDVPTIFFALAAYVIGNFMDKAIPRYGFIARWLNPHPFNAKEHVAITILASSSAQVAFAVKVIAAQRLYYSNAPSPALSILVVISSQCIGYGFAGLFRRALVYPVKMFWPVLLPITSLLEMLHRGRNGTTIQRRVFYWVFTTIFVWQLFPEYIMPMMTGLSVFCLANQNSQIFTTIFGGSNPNEGLGFLSLGLNWRFITSQPLWYPLQTLVNGFVGYLICIILFAGIYYGNVWDARNFPFSSQLLYSEASTESNYVLYNQRLLLDQNNKLDGDVIDNRGLPYFAATYATSLLTNNLYITCTIIHLCLWNFGDLKKAWSFLHPANLKRLITPSFWTSNPEVVDHDEVENNPHYQFMRAYKECPNWWYAAIFLVSLIGGLVCVYVAETTLSWYGYFIGIFLAGILTFFFGAQAAITGYQGNLQPLMQLLGGRIHPGKPIATLYFTLFSHGSITQAISLTQHLKLGQYAKVPPRITFTVQIAGTLVGSIISYIAMAEITKDQRDLLLATRGSSVWSGAHVQELHTQVHLPPSASPHPGR
ncbi:Oligopeptide transporter OPT superfamily [Macrophomina phaseolina MS6]|uniref:Oligopeptide transporter OPT superfamily n=1 Tax=Macrophomina phaseolina (strain MS6) TaxID=1126212 RepID=K2S0G9_MACPH|nr:Oligopeptide transporter OPT superfamily [Macrophomina phaseolina MS6]